TLILALQDLPAFESVFENASKLLVPQGKFIIVMNHPCFRIPRQSAWGINEQSKLQYRTMNGYMSPQNIPIFTKPSQKESSPHVTYHHHPLSHYINALSKHHFVIEEMHEWVSNKESTGKMAKMENRARTE